ncbi:hypothetical protein SPB21_14955 [Leptothoe sp. ISB3NOV94-8A]|nr:hypothetical protein [Adonisia turfae]MDV3352923.1 hypothetical protein [Leptothoe sp. LEGE 181152]
MSFRVVWQDKDVCRQLGTLAVYRFISVSSRFSMVQDGHPTPDQQAITP